MNLHPEPGTWWNRYLPLSGAAFTVLMVVSAASFPMPPGGDVSPASNPAFLAAHAGAVITQSYLRALAGLAFIALAAALAAACRRVLPATSSLPTAALVGGALSGGFALLAQAATLSAAQFALHGGSADAVRALGALQTGILDMSAIPAALLFAAVGVATIRTALLPRWLAAFTLVGVPLALLDAASYDGGPLESVGLLGLGYFLVWGLLVGVRLWLTSRTVTVSGRGEALAKQDQQSAA